MKKDEVCDDITFVGGQKRRDNAVGIISIGISFLVVILGLMFLPNDLVTLPDNVVKTLLISISGPLFVIIIGVMLYLKYVKQKPVIHIKDEVVEISPVSIAFNSDETRELKIPIKHIQKIIPSLDAKSTEHIISGIKNGTIHVFNKDRIKKLVKGPSGWTLITKILYQSFVIIDKDNVYYFVTRDFEEIEQIIDCLLHASKEN